MLMLLGAQGSELRRLRTAFLFLLMGLVLVFWAWGNWMYRASSPALAQRIVSVTGNTESSGAVDPGEPKRVAGVMWLVLGFGLTLLFVLIFGTYTLMRAARTYRETVAIKGGAASPPIDAWNLHRLPDTDDGDPLGADAAGE